LSKEQKKPEDWKSIKIKADTKEKLEDMGVGIGRAVEILVEAKRQAVSDKIGNISELTGDIADILLSSGMLDIKFRGSGIDDVSIDGDCVVIRGFIKAGISDADAREEIYRVMKDGLERQA